MNHVCVGAELHALCTENVCAVITTVCVITKRSVPKWIWMWNENRRNVCATNASFQTNIYVSFNRQHIFFITFPAFKQRNIIQIFCVFAIAEYCYDAPLSRALIHFRCFVKKDEKRKLYRSLMRSIRTSLRIRLYCLWSVLCLVFFHTFRHLHDVARIRMSTSTEIFLNNNKCKMLAMWMECVCKAAWIS